MELRRRWTIDPMWRQVAAFLFVMFFIFVADAALADFVPGFMQNVFGSPLLMGIVMSTSSIAGLTLDLLFARILSKTDVKSMLLLSGVGSLIFGLLLYMTTWWPYLILFVAAMVVWGLYYEFFGFASQKFVVSIATPARRTAVWSVLETIRAVAYAVGPLPMTWVASSGDKTVILATLCVASLGLLTLLFVPLKQKYDERVVDHAQITVWHELAHWKSLLVHIWPLAIMGLVLGIVDAVFWTTGTIVNDSLAERSSVGGLFLTVYMLSSLVVGFIFGRSMIKSGKKKLAEIFILISGLLLTLITLVDAVWWILFIVFVSSAINALAWPLLDAVYTDLLARMGREQVHMVGLRNSSYSLAYVVGPIAAGWLATVVGELPSFKYLGFFLVAIATVLLFTTPRKLRLPQADIAQWE